MQYMGQLNDLEISSPVQSVGGADDWNKLVGAFEETFARVYASAATSPELGYGITGAVMHGTVEVKKPAIPSEEDAGPFPADDAKMGSRKFYFEGKWHDAQLYIMEKIKAGNKMVGPCVIESDATTFVVPPGFETTMDKHRLFHLVDKQ
jgi:acetone carboxylase beta subunit